MCIGVIRTQPYSFLKMVDCFIPKLSPGKSVAKVTFDECRPKAVMALSVPGSYIQRRLKF